MNRFWCLDREVIYRLAVFDDARAQSLLTPRRLRGSTRSGAICFSHRGLCPLRLHSPSPMSAPVASEDQRWHACESAALMGRHRRMRSDMWRAPTTHDLALNNRCYQEKLISLEMLSCDVSQCGVRPCLNVFYRVPVYSSLVVRRRWLCGEGNIHLPKTSRGRSTKSSDTPFCERETAKS